MTTRFVDEGKLLELLDGKVSEKPLPPGLNGDSDLRKWLKRQPKVPKLVSRQAAAKILGIESPHVTRYIQQGRMPEPIEVEGGYPVYVRSEVVKFGRELKRERDRRAKARAER